MKKYVYIIVILFVLGCNTNKKVQLISLNNENVEINFIEYNEKKVSLYFQKKLKLKNPYLEVIQKV